MRCTHSHTQWHSATLLSAASLSREIARAPVYTFTYLSIYLNFVCLWRIYLFNIWFSRAGRGRGKARAGRQRARLAGSRGIAGRGGEPLAAPRGRAGRVASCISN